MTAETSMLYVAPLLMLTLGAIAFVMSSVLGDRQERRLQPIRVRRNRDVRR